MTSVLIVMMCLLGQNPSPTTFRDGPAAVRWNAASEKDGLVLPFVQPLQILLTVDGPGPIQVSLSDPVVTSTGWRERTRSPVRVIRNGQEEHWEQTLTLEAVAPQATTLQLVPWSYRLGASAWRTVTAPAVSVRLELRSGSEDDALRDITAIEASRITSDPPSWQRLAWPVAALLVIGILGLSLHSRSPARTPRDPRARALQELRRLERLRLLEAGKRERFFTLLDGILRHYLESCHDLPARRRTVPEVLRLIRGTPALIGDVNFLDPFMQACEAAKFCPARAVPELGERLARELRTWLETQPLRGRVDSSS